MIGVTAAAVTAGHSAASDLRLALLRAVGRGRPSGGLPAPRVVETWTTAAAVHFEKIEMVSEVAPAAGEREAAGERGEWDYQGRFHILCAETQVGGEALDTPRPRPAVIFLHGTGSSATKVAAHLEQYAKAGFVAVGFDSRYHGARGGGTDAYARALRSAWVDGSDDGDGSSRGIHPFIYDSIHDLIVVMDYLASEARPGVDGTRIGATGISLGGMHAWFLAAADTRVAAVAPMIGVQGFRYAVDNDAWHARVASIAPAFQAAADELNGGEIDSEVVARVWKRIAPGLAGRFDAPHTLGLIAPRPILVANGEKDPRCPIAGVEAAVEAGRAAYAAQGADPSLLELYVGSGLEHEISAEMLERVLTFFRRHLLLRPDEAGGGGGGGGGSGVGSGGGGSGGGGGSDGGMKSEL